MKTTKIPRKIFIDSTYTLRQEIWEGTGQMFLVIRNKFVGKSTPATFDTGYP